jgi:hypothetical protein
VFSLTSHINTEICTICNPLNSSKSGLENQLFNFISNNINVKRNERKILDNKYELDIYISELKLAFEFNGLWWHNYNEDIYWDWVDDEKDFSNIKIGDHIRVDVKI